MLKDNSNKMRQKSNRLKIGNIEDSHVDSTKQTEVTRGSELGS